MNSTKRDMILAVVIGNLMLLFLFLIPAVTGSAAQAGNQAYLPLVRNREAAIQTAPNPERLVPPQGIHCFGTDVTSRRDAAGTRWINCQARDNQGQVVWKQDANGSQLVLRSGYGGRGSLDDDDEGLWLTVWDLSGDFGVRIKVEGWAR